MAMMPDSLTSLRDMFLPVLAVKMKMHPNIRLYLQINYKLDSLILGVFGPHASDQIKLISMPEFEQPGFGSIVQSRLDAAIQKVLPSPGEAEYDEIMQAQEIMEEINGTGVHQG